MPQLVGMNCVLCQARISNDLDARFCPACENPRHDSCVHPPQEPTDTLCRECGAAVVPEKLLPRSNDRPPSRQQQRGPFRISDVCPRCKSEKCKLVRPQGFIAFKWDRVCKDCGTRYTPPTPIWASIVFIVAGLKLAGIMSLGVLYQLMSGPPLAVPAMAYEGFLVVIYWRSGTASGP